MSKKAAIILVLLAMLGPSVALVSVGALMSPSAGASCTVPGASPHLTVGEVPEELEVTTANGETFTLNQEQLTHAATIIETGTSIEAVSRDGLVIALMAALTESTLRQLSNETAYPDSADYPNDGDGSDHDSLGLFQMRPSTGWGSVEDLMDPIYQAEAFFGGPEGPNSGSPRGLLDIPGWQEMDKGEAAQAVEVSAYPDRYRNYEPVAETILEALTAGSEAGPASVPESGRVVFPLPEDAAVQTSDYGPRVHPVTGEDSFHAGTDWAAPDGTPIYAIADGVVASADYNEARGGVIVIDHTINGEAVSSVYIHMWETGIHIQPGDTVSAGDHIGDVGNSGQSTGPHLHLEIWPGGPDTGEHTDPEPWLATHDAHPAPSTGSGSSTQPAGAEGEDCPTEPDQTAEAGEPEPSGGDGSQMLDDPTTGGQITAAMLHLYQQTSEAFPETSWVCWDERPGQDSEHPLGRACDVTFGNPIGSFPTEAQRQAGWEVTNWVKDHAETLGVEYLIFDGKIWVASRADEGWRPYDGGGMHDPNDPTGGHYDHLHITVTDN
ncbi:M23 family metallopeptidase [Nesterenkonia sp.]|uniref:M23 family metallopeptidase n=1 Tax=Nesterenkonia sp. TaxID=704201 RepID=UPI00260B749A|nr:M23 family metallopeptidase [Nesterenkonia sp.]